METDLIRTAAAEAEPVTRERVATHVAGCGGCRQALDGYRAIEDALPGIRALEPPVAAVSAARDRLEARLLDLRSRLVEYRVFGSPLGSLLIARSEQGVILVEYLEGETVAQVTRRLRQAGGLELAEGGEEIESVHRDLVDYLGGRRRHLDWPLDLRLARTDFQRAVLRATASIPYGAVVSYTRVARDVGRPDAVRAVAQALRWNPLPIVIPCHRVIGASGALVGYAGGPTTPKQRLLAIEGVPVVPLAHDYGVRREMMYVLMPGDSEYCLPSCPSTADLRHRAPMLFGSRERAEAAGLHPCTTCRPDLHPLGVN